MVNKLSIISSATMISLLFVGCHPKTVPVITDRKSDPPARSVLIYPPKETITPDTIAGKRIFMNRCGRCHALPLPDQFSIKRWDNILPVMIPRARMNNEESLHVRSWLLANASR